MTAIQNGQLELFSDDDLEQIHETAIAVLEEKGIKIESKEALELLDDNGADVDYDEQIAKMPRSLVEETAEQAPSSFEMGARDPENSFTLDPGTSVFGPGIGVTKIMDLETGNRRKPTREDVSDAVRLADSLPRIDVTWPTFSLPDDPMLGFYNLYSLLTENTKHGAIVNWYGGELTEKLIDMIDIVSDGPTEESRLVTMYSEPVSPLVFRRENMESILKWTEAGLPLVWYPAQQPGATSPVTLAGNVAQALAETLGGNTIAQLNNPGTPVIMGICPSVMDLKQGINLYFEAEMMTVQTVAGQLGNFYDIPVFGHGGTTNAYSMDFQAGMESALTLYGAVLGGQNFIHDIGFAGHSDVGSLELITLVDEMIGMVDQMVNGMPINEETLALDVIKNVDHGGSFLGESHTQKHGRDALFLPELLDVVPESQWADNRAVEKAREKTLKLLESADPEPLPEEVHSELDEKMEEARARTEEIDML